MSVKKGYIIFLILLALAIFEFIPFYIALASIFVLPAIYSITNNLEEDKEKKHWGIVTDELESRNNQLAFLLLFLSFIYVNMQFSSAQKVKNYEKVLSYCERFEESGINCSIIREILDEDTSLLGGYDDDMYN